MDNTAVRTGVGSVAAPLPQSIVDCLLTKRQLPIPRSLVLIMAALAIFISLLHVYSAFFTQIEFHMQRHVVLSMLLALFILLKPLRRKSWQHRLNKFFAVDLILIVMAIAPTIHYYLNLERMLMGSLSITPGDIIASSATLLVVLETTRRMTGWPILIIVAFFALQNTFGPYFPWIFQGPAVQWKETVYAVYLETWGIYGTPLATLTGFLIVFFILTGVMKETGASKIFLNLAMSLTGQYRGGPAKMAVIGSAFFGTISGSPSANVVGTGTFTIPLMKSLGYPPEFAASVEAVSSTGGQFVPPIMGVAAFLMAQFLGISYFRICLAGILPAAVYYAAVFSMVHLRAAKLGLKGMPKEELPSVKTALSRGWVIIVPVLLMFFLIWQAFPLGRIGLLATLALLVLTMLRKETRIGPVALLRALEEGARLAASIVPVLAAAGIIIGVFYTSGLADKLASAIIAISAGNILIALFLVAILCIVLGMGMPCTAVYIMMVVITIPALIRMGIDPLTAHFFTFFMGTSSAITPPVAITSFVAASIAGSNLMRTAFTAFKLGIIAYIIPFLFVYEPAWLWRGSPGEIITVAVGASIGMFALAIGIEGHLLHKANWLERAIFLICAGCLFMSSIPIKVVGLAILTPLILFHAITERKHRASSLRALDVADT